MRHVKCRHAPIGAFVEWLRARARTASGCEYLAVNIVNRLRIFYNVNPGQTGNMNRMVIDGPGFYNLDAAVLKNVRVKENVRFQIRFIGHFQLIITFVASSRVLLHTNKTRVGRSIKSSTREICLNRCRDRQRGR